MSSSRRRYRLTYEDKNYEEGAGNRQSPPPSPTVPQGLRISGPNRHTRYIFTTTALVQQSFPAFGLCNLAAGSAIEVWESRTFRMRHAIPFEDAVGEFYVARWMSHSTYHMNSVAPIAPDVSSEVLAERYRLIARYCEFIDNIYLGRVSNSKEANVYSDIERNVFLSWESIDYPLGASFRSFHEGRADIWWRCHNCGHFKIVQSLN